MANDIPLSPWQCSINRILWLAIAALLAADAAWLYSGQVTVTRWQDAASSLAMIMSVFVLIAVAAKKRGNETACLFGHVLGQLALQGIGIGLLSYLGAGLSLPLADSWLAYSDALFGFDWPSYVHWLDKAPPECLMLLWLSYNSFKVQLVLMPFVLFAYRQSAHAQRLIIAILLSGVACVALSALLPAEGAYRYYGMDAASLRHIDPTFIRAEQGIILDIRKTPQVIAMPLHGIICFPSFHAVVALLLIYASWPLRYVRWLLIPFNAVMLLSTLSEGGHYLVDVLAGSIIGLLAIFLAEKALPVRPPADRLSNPLDRASPSQSWRRKQ